MFDFKSSLNIHCQKCCLPIPKYSTTQLSNLLLKSSTPQFKSSVHLHDGRIFESQGTFGNKKSAEQSAAEQALKNLKESQETPQGKASPTSSLIPKATAVQIPIVKHCDSTASVMSPDSSSSGPSQSPTQKNTSPNTPKPSLAMSKNLLNERAQKLHFAMPVYNSFIENGSFCSIVTVNNATYRSKGFHRLKKDAEKSAAQEALLVLASPNQTPQQLTPSRTESVMPIGQSGSVGELFNTSNTPQSSFNVFRSQQSPDGTPIGQSSSASKLLNTSNTPQSNCNVFRSQQTPDGTTPKVYSYKNLLQEYMQQRRRGDTPKYSTIPADNGLFKSAVSFCGKTVVSNQGFSTKKEAEQSAAREALLSLGIEDPETLASTPKDGGKRIAKHIIIQPLLQLISQARKRPRLDDNNTPLKRLKLESLAVVKEAGHINSLSVGEVWKEKGNVALVGNADMSFVMYCTRAGNSLQILNTRTMLNHTLEPGHRIICLDADVVSTQGRLVLQAERCADVEVPDEPDPVLISCGVVMLHQQDSSRIEVLLKRYLISQAFVNAKAALAQYFRRALTGNPLALPIDSLTEHIDTWKLDEVVAIATMTASAIKRLFSTLWKFKDQWSKVLEPPLPADLIELQARAQQELTHRNANGVNITDLENHPWSLPKGNFRHRILSTGLHIEKPCECAARELSEETGIQLYSDDLETVPYIDVPQSDNLNPHKGDVSRYFLYAYKKKPSCASSKTEYQTTFLTDKLKTTGNSTEMTSKTQPIPSSLVNNKTVDGMTQPELSSENTTSKDDRTESSEDEIKTQKMQPVSLSQLFAEQSTPVKPSNSTRTLEKPSPEFFVLDDLCTSESTSSSSSSPPPTSKTSLLNTKFPCTKGQELAVDGDDKMDLAIETNINDERTTKQHKNDVHQQDGNAQRGRKRKRSISDDEEEEKENLIDQPSTPSADMTSSVKYQSPSVKAGNHEECAWFLVEEAVNLSPVFAKIYEDQKFVDLLESLKG